MSPPPDGAVHYHRFPQYAPSSAVEVVKAVIDTVWDRPPVRDELGEGLEPSRRRTTRMGITVGTNDRGPGRDSG
jgi:hypothetical protein